ncbi:hypothetical protein LP416_09470 [Polaromonas sp. P2-4]|nr:hypothetical protein LP416_09470 [Polaromonas sp. P2-4]
MRKTLTSILLFGLAAAAGPLAYAQARPASGNIEFKNIAEVEVEVKAADGKIEKNAARCKRPFPARW